VLNDQGFAQATRSLYEEALVKPRWWYNGNTDHPDVAMCMDSLAGYVCEQGAYGDAAALLVDQEMRGCNSMVKNIPTP
jgi:hypothetical protein